MLQAKIKKNQVMPEAVEFASLDYKLSSTSEDSLLHSTPPKYEHTWLVFYIALQCFAYQHTTVYDCTLVTPQHLLLCVGLGVHIIEDYSYSMHDPSRQRKSTRNAWSLAMQLKHMPTAHSKVHTK